MFFVGVIAVDLVVDAGGVGYGFTLFFVVVSVQGNQRDHITINSAITTSGSDLFSGCLRGQKMSN